MIDQKLIAKYATAQIPFEDEKYFWDNVFFEASSRKDWTNKRLAFELEQKNPEPSFYLLCGIVATPDLAVVISAIAKFKPEINAGNFLKYVASRGSETANGDFIWTRMATGGHYDQIRFAIDNALFNPNTCVGNGQTIWHIAAAYGKVNWLLLAWHDGLFDPYTTKSNYGSNVWDRFPKEVKDDGLRLQNANTMYHLLAMHGLCDVLETDIIAKRFNPNTLTNNQGTTIWGYLLEFGHYKFVSKALQKQWCDPAHLLNYPAGMCTPRWHALAIKNRYDDACDAIDTYQLEQNKLLNSNSIWISFSAYGHLDSIYKAIDTKRLNPKVEFNKNGNSVWHIFAAKFPEKFKQAVADGYCFPEEYRNQAGKIPTDLLPLPVPAVAQAPQLSMYQAFIKNMEDITAVITNSTEAAIQELHIEHEEEDRYAAKGHLAKRDL